jgi:predicted DNA-binding transcriptional regulator AlpA
MYSLLTHDRIFQHCGIEFVSQKRSTKYCSHRCANLTDKARKKAQKQLLKQENAKEERRQDLLQKNFLSITEAAKLLQVSLNTIYILIKKHDVKSPINSTPQELAERDASLITREEVTKTYNISTAWFFSQLKKHGIKAQRIAGGCFYNKEDMERIFSHKEFLHITEWYTFQQLKDMTGFRTESICDIIRTNKIPKKKINNCVYLSKKH